MKLLEHEAKQLLYQAGIPIPAGCLIKKHRLLPKLHLPIVLKSQVPTGGRGKHGGVVIVASKNRLGPMIDSLFQLPIKGLYPKTILAEEKLSIQRELYVSLSIDRETTSVRLLAHSAGGIEIETQTRDKLLSMEVDSDTLYQTAKRTAAQFNLSQNLIEPFLTALYSAFVKNDATLLEINPLVLTTQNNLVAGDCKMELDDAADFRHPEWSFAGSVTSSNFVILNPQGNVGTIANGAGLGMATVDAVNASGLKAANFLDIGGGANTRSVVAAFSKIISLPNVKVIIINIFAGITRCDEVARAIIEAKKHLPHLPPLSIRLAGTNFKEAASLLTTQNISPLSTLEECLTAAKRDIYG